MSFALVTQTEHSGGSRISRRGGRAPVRGAVYLRRGHFSVKMYAKTKELGPIGGGGACARHAPPRSANGTHLKCNDLNDP